MNNDILLSVQDLSVAFQSDQGLLSAVDHVNFDIRKGESVGIVGESGCGKSVTSMSIMRLLPEPPARVKGSILFEGRDIRGLSSYALRALRGNEIAMIFQEPMTALNPVYTCGRQIAEAIIRHQSVDRRDAREKTLEILKLVGIPTSEKWIDKYPHQLSGGMRQRVMIAMALSCHPKLLIADEPTTALDVTIQAQILELIRELKERLDMSMILITHDLGVVAEMTRRVMIMYAGEIVEEAEIHEIFHSPLHPYTAGLLSSIPRLDRKEELKAIEGVVPTPGAMPSGCRFAPRCQMRAERCMKEPPRIQTGEEHFVRCWLLQEKQ
jgi:oligopeptide/dipeptide ABC transporter ATP-binding protein